ncbi:MAG: hypothetical protein K0M78_02295, partial [Brevundimonas sp.]|nr:hypothetical protein [Brevundimonas sp.]
GTLIKLFEKEQETRSDEDEKIREKLQGMSNLFFGLRMAWAVVTAIALLVFGGLAGWAIPKLLDKPVPAAAAEAAPGTKAG